MAAWVICILHETRILLQTSFTKLTFPTSNQFKEMFNFQMELYIAASKAALLLLQKLHRKNWQKDVITSYFTDVNWLLESYDK